MKPAPIEYRQLTDEELDEIKRFAKVEGRKWKESLVTRSWWRGIPCRDKNGDEYQHLYGLRNTHGPSWLTNFRLPA